jgi:uncharacterized protein (TIGR00296 family)
MPRLSLADGKLLVSIARKAIEGHLSGEPHSKLTELPKRLQEMCGIFVTLETYPDKELRGCIGFPQPTHSIAQAVEDAAVSAATQDPRFPIVGLEELPNLLIEITVLTPPELIEAKSPELYPNSIEIGKDGLIVELGLTRGLLLPQVPFHFSPPWDAEEFLTQTCYKAGLPGDSWKTGKVKVYKFQGQIFAEEKPNGSVVEKEFK